MSDFKAMHQIRFPLRLCSDLAGQGAVYPMDNVTTSKTAKRQSVQWRIQDFLTGKPSVPFSAEPGHRVGYTGITPLEIFQISCVTIVVGKTETRRLILASVVNASSRRRRGLHVQGGPN